MHKKARNATLQHSIFTDTTAKNRPFTVLSTELAFVDKCSLNAHINPVRGTLWILSDPVDKCNKNLRSNDALPCRFP